jgi:hypothetical protein
LLLLRDQSRFHGKQGMQWSPARRRGWARWGGLSIRHLALHRQWRCCRRRHREAVHEAGHGRRQYNVEMAEQRGVSLCRPLHTKAARAIHSTTWRIWGEPLPPPAQVRGDQLCVGNGGCCSLQMSLFCSEDCRLCCEMVNIKQSIGIGNQ